MYPRKNQLIKGNRKQLLVMYSFTHREYGRDEDAKLLTQ